MTNIELFNYSKENTTPIIDPYYQKGKLVITANKDEVNSLMLGNAELLELITVFNYLNKRGREASNSEVLNVVERIIKILDSVSGINFSAFSQFFMVYNSTHSAYLELEKAQKRDFVYQMLQHYCNERHQMYLSHGYSDIVLQVLSDNYSHKRNSKTSIVKIEDSLKKREILRNRAAFDLDSSKNFYFLPDKGDEGNYQWFKEEFSLKTVALAQEQNKLPDMVIKVGTDYYIVEAKMMKGAGGGQDKQLVEIINFIRYSETNPRIHYLVYFDGSYANLLFGDDRTPKIETQYQDIMGCLARNPQNFFVNHAGFEKLLSRLNSI